MTNYAAWMSGYAPLALAHFYPRLYVPMIFVSLGCYVAVLVVSEKKAQ